MRYLILLLPGIAFASERGLDIRQSNDLNNQTGGDINIDGGSPQTNLNYGGSRAYGFSHGLGDVAIADCMGTQQWGSIIVSRQKMILNRWCAASEYDRMGLFDVAAMMRCTIPEIASLFGSNIECLGHNTVIPVPVSPEPPPVVSAPAPMPVEEIVEEVLIVVEEQHKEQEEMVVELQARVVDLAQEKEAIEEDRQDRREYRRSFAQGIIEKLDAAE